MKADQEQPATQQGETEHVAKQVAVPVTAIPKGQPQVQEQVVQPAKFATTTLQHPKLPSTATMIERIALPFAFSLITALIHNPAHAAELQEYMEPLRDTLNAVYPPE